MSDIAEPRPGARGRVETTVATGDTAASLGSGDVPVLGTPRVLALAEEATVAALENGLEAGRTTVGTRIALRHTAPTPTGARVRAEAELTEVDGKRLVFEVKVVQLDRNPAGSDGADGRTVATGTIERVTVDRERFITSAEG
ncbi:thioesterase family protein [Nocardiopsis halophila]|uniref:thioesterase family protein n=1 Tax=Nocardiopsis halophila TaxID=141692 RepID=UPI000346601B|nr:hotdog domain-containing protein [Nocardiopsis halophila]